MTETPKQKQVQRPVPFKVGVALGIIALLLIGFLAGQAAERNRVRHFIGWRNNYQRNFFGPRSFEAPPHFIRAHSLLGKILTTDNDKLIVQGHDNVEQSIVLNDQTVIRRDGASAARSDLKANQQIAVFGEPNNEGQIVAKLIRIFEENENPIP